jgi:hypothetical protein
MVRATQSVGDALGERWVRSAYGTRYRAGMVEIRTDDQHPSTAVREKLQRTGAALARWRADVWGSGVRGCRRTGVFGTKEQP